MVSLIVERLQFHKLSGARQDTVLWLKKDAPDLDKTGLTQGSLNQLLVAYGNECRAQFSLR